MRLAAALAAAALLLPRDALALDRLLTWSWTPGASKTLCDTKCKACSNTSPWTPVAEDCTDDGDFCISLQYSQGSCWSPPYADASWAVTKGTVDSSNGATKLLSYEVGPTGKRAAQFAASGAEVYFRFATKKDYAVFSWTAAEGFKKTGDIAAADVTVGKHIATGITVHGGRADPMSVLFLDTDFRTSAWPKISATLDGALLSNTNGVTVNVQRYEGPAGSTMFDPVKDYTNPPPSTTYGTPRRYWPFTYGDGSEGVLWQDIQNKKIYHSKFAADLSTVAHTEVNTWSADEILSVAAGDGKGKVIYFLWKTGQGPDKDTPTSARAIKYDADTGKNLLVTNVDTTELNTWQQDGWQGAAVWSPERCEFGVMLSHKQTRSGDGLNHQTGKFFVYNADDLTTLKNHGQVTGHCWMQSLMLSADGSGDFIGLAAGDNYPRSLRLLSGNFDKRKTRDVYGYKTAHATRTQKDAWGTSCAKCDNIYTDISDSTCPGSGTCFYTWSNDNTIYTEPGRSGFVQVSDGVLVFFAGEKDSMSGLDNSKVGGWSERKTPRNVGFVKVSPCTPDSCGTSVLSPGGKQQQKYYSFGGSIINQENEGVNWLTNYVWGDEDNVSRLKNTRINGKIVLIWEVWTESTFKRTAMMIVDDNGSPTKNEFNFEQAFRMPFSEDFILRNGKMVMYSGAGPGSESPIGSGSSAPQTSKLVRIEIEVPGGTSGGTGPPPLDASLSMVPSKGQCPADPTTSPVAGATPSVSPSAAPAAPPTTAPSAAPVAAPTAAPARSPTAAPAAPSAAPAQPTAAPAAAPTTAPAQPTAAPAAAPSAAPTAAPGANPTLSPADPTVAPSAAPAGTPSVSPSNAPVTPGTPTAAPVVPPTQGPSLPPAPSPTAAPVTAGTPTGPPLPPAGSPTAAPVKQGAPTSAPAAPAGAPTAAPAAAPSASPIPPGVPTAAPVAGAPPTAAPAPPPGSPTAAPAVGTPPTAAPAAPAAGTPTAAPAVSPTAAPVAPGTPTAAPAKATSAPAGPPATPGAPTAAPAAAGGSPSAAPAAGGSAGPPTAAPAPAPGSPTAAPAAGGAGAPSESPKNGSSGGTSARNECLPVNPCGSEQDCVDPDTRSDMLLDFECVCKVAAKGGEKARAWGTRARCQIDECAWNPCGPDQFCNDPNQTARSTSQTAVAAGWGDFICTCKDGAVRVGAPADCGSDPSVLCNGITCGGGQACLGGLCQCTPPTYGVAPGHAADCRLDDCYAGSVEVCGQGQMCTDPDTARAANFVCACLPPYSGAAVGSRARCRYDDCVGQPCGKWQDCMDPDPAMEGVFVCTCSSGGGKPARNRPAADCIGLPPAEAPAEVDAARGAALEETEVGEAAKRTILILAIILGLFICACCLFLAFLWRRRRSRPKVQTVMDAFSGSHTEMTPQLANLQYHDISQRQSEGGPGEPSRTFSSTVQGRAPPTPQAPRTPRSPAMRSQRGASGISGGAAPQASFNSETAPADRSQRSGAVFSV